MAGPSLLCGGSSTRSHQSCIISIAAPEVLLPILRLIGLEAKKGNVPYNGRRKHP
ncbi:hypothetical protein [Ammoniphilus sp. YIM 78166]|uniref:hypothetical protein n=1 Tax=Ammoniphilus sp. YIM 78166 TaxID=1644106 RepID=UPI00142FA167|nr:hypothetical protein [Ammoniphilus sp. YIM 78166]